MRYNTQLEDDDLIHDGGRVRVPILAMDDPHRPLYRRAARAIASVTDPLAGHRPGFYCGDGGEANDDAHNAWLERGRQQRDAWRDGVIVTGKKPKVSFTDDRETLEAAANQAWLERGARQRDAWKTAV